MLAEPMQLIDAVQRGLAADVAALLAAGADVNELSPQGNTPLVLACLHGYTEVVTTLLAADADLNQTAARGDAPLLAA